MSFRMEREHVNYPHTFGIQLIPLSFHSSKVNLFLTYLDLIFFYFTLIVRSKPLTVARWEGTGGLCCRHDVFSSHHRDTLRRTLSYLILRVGYDVYYYCLIID